MSDVPLLEIQELSVQFDGEDGPLCAVDGVSLRVDRGETVGLVGESGVGKSATALAVLRLLPEPAGRVTGGRVLFEGVELLSLGERELRKIRGRRIAMVFQEPMSALNPVLRVGEQVAEGMRLHHGATRSQARQRTLELFTRLGIGSPEERMAAHPHQLSGGMRQRVLLAMALAGEPSLLLADEPTTALDVTLQAQILALLKSIQQRTGLGVLLISHNVSLVAESCDRVVVFYAGQVVESAPTARLLASPRHPYSAALLTVARAFSSESGLLAEIPGSLPDPRRWPRGCRFADRCGRAEEDCRAAVPPLTFLDESRVLRCYHPLRDERP